MSLRKRIGEYPITDPHKLWAAWLGGAIAFHHPGRINGPLHPDTRREFEAGHSAAARGYVRVPDFDEALSLMRHVRAGNPPHTYRECAAV